MELNEWQKSIAELRKNNRRLTLACACLAALVVVQTVVILGQGRIIQYVIPGISSGMEVGRSAMSMDGQRAVLIAVTDHLASVNPSNVEQQKRFVQAFLSPEAYTRISRQMDEQAQTLSTQHELGSYYFVFKEHRWDAELKKHFIVGDVHTVNSAHDSGEPWVFEYEMHVENYKPVVDSVVVYKGDKPHDSVYLKGQMK